MYSNDDSSAHFLTRVHATIALTYNLDLPSITTTKKAYACKYNTSSYWLVFVLWYRVEFKYVLKHIFKNFKFDRKKIKLFPISKGIYELEMLQVDICHVSRGNLTDDWSAGCNFNKIDASCLQLP